MKSFGATILTLVMLLGMLGGEPARALSGLVAGVEPSGPCGRGGVDSCCCSGGGCEETGNRETYEPESCPCSRGPTRGSVGVPAVAALVAGGRSILRERVSETTAVQVIVVPAVAVTSLVGPGRVSEPLSVGERLAWWCVRQV